MVGIVLIMTTAVGRPSLMWVAPFPALRSRIVPEEKAELSSHALLAFLSALDSGNVTASSQRLP